MAEIYADLVELGLRSLDENENGIVLVPTFWREKVKIEMKNREELSK